MEFTFPFTLDLVYVVLVVAVTEAIFTSLAYFKKFYTAPIKLLITFLVGLGLAAIDLGFAYKDEGLTKAFVYNLLLNFAVAQSSYDIIMKNVKTFLNNYVFSKLVSKDSQ